MAVVRERKIELMNFRCPSVTREQIEALAAAERRSRSAVIREAIIFYVEQKAHQIEATSPEK